MPTSKRIETSQQTGYQRLLDQESLEYEKAENPRALPFRHDLSDLLSYRVGFWALSLLYILTVALSFTAWQSDSSPNVTSYGIVDIPFDETVVFMPDAAFETSADSKSDDDPWSRLEPAGRGFIEVPVEVGLPDGQKVMEKQYYCISMFHQLHCLASLKVAFSSMTNKSEDSDGHMRHLNHCFDYLRQAVMCAGDMTLEPAVEYKEIGRKGVAGWNVEHKCRSFQAMKDFAEQHTYLNSTGIL